MVRLYTSLPFEQGHLIPLSLSHYHYLSRVMRLEEGESFFLFNGYQGLWKALLQKKKGYLVDQVEDQPSAMVPLEVRFSLIRQQNWLIEKATEIGATSFFPFVSHHSHIRSFSHERHEKIIQEACEQSHRLSLPSLHNLTSFTEAFSSMTSPLWVLDPLSEKNVTHGPSYPQGIVVGPEGGWSPQERLFFSQHSSFFPLSLGPHILRAETAVIVGLTYLMARRLEEKKDF